MVSKFKADFSLVADTERITQIFIRDWILIIKTKLNKTNTCLKQKSTSKGIFPSPNVIQKLGIGLLH